MKHCILDVKEKLMNSIKDLLGKRIKELRKNRNWTQEYLAELIGIDTRNFIKIENGQTFPRSQTLDKLIEVFDISPVEIFQNEHLQEVSLLRKKIITKLETDDNLVRLIYKMLF